MYDVLYDMLYDIPYNRLGLATTDTFNENIVYCFAALMLRACNIVLPPL